MEHYRREYLSIGGVTVASLLAGCSGGNSGNGLSPPDENADTQGLLPEPPDSWEKVSEQEQLAGTIGAEGGYAANYNSPDNVGGDVVDADYRVEILRWSSDSDAESESQGIYAEDPVLVTLGNFSFAGKGPNVDDLVLLLSNSSALTEEYIRNNNMNE